MGRPTAAIKGTNADRPMLNCREAPNLGLGSGWSSRFATSMELQIQFVALFGRHLAVTYQFLEGAHGSLRYHCPTKSHKTNFEHQSVKETNTCIFQ